MRRGIALALALLAHGAAASAQEATHGCIEGPEVSGGRYDTYLLTRALSVRPTCVRYRFRLDLWRSVDDTAQRGPDDRRLVGDGGLYDALVREAQRAGAFVILTVGLDAAGVTPAQLGASDARTRYAEAVASLATRFRGRVRAIELEGQPNRRAEGDAGSVPRIPAALYAPMLVAVQERLRPLAESLRCEMPDVIVGGLYDGPASTMASSADGWLLALYEALAADPAAAQLRAWGREPVADLGVQLAAQAVPGVSSSWLAGAAESVLSNIRWDYDNRLTGMPRPRVWITAGAYRAASPSAEDQRQLIEAMDYFRVAQRTDLPIRPVVLGWSPVNEPADACAGFGLFRDCVADDEHTRMTFDAVGNGIGMSRPEPWARLEFTDPSVRVAAGSTATVHLRVTNASPNRSDAPWWAASSNLFIAQPEGCPTTPAMNNVPWTGLPVGSVESPLAVGARIRFVPPNPMPPTVSTVVTWTIAPPRDLAPGPLTVAARMQEGARWFGPWATIPVEILPPSLDAGADAGPDAALDAGRDVWRDATDVPTDAAEGSVDAPEASSDIAAPDVISLEDAKDARPEAAAVDLGGPPADVAVDAANAADAEAVEARRDVPSVDAGPAPSGAGGCGCAVPRARPTPAALLVGLAWIGIRRRRRER